VQCHASSGGCTNSAFMYENVDATFWLRAVNNWQLDTARTALAFQKKGLLEAQVGDEFSSSCDTCCHHLDFRKTCSAWQWYIWRTSLPKQVLPRLMALTPFLPTGGANLQGGSCLLFSAMQFWFVGRMAVWLVTGRDDRLKNCFNFLSRLLSISAEYCMFGASCSCSCSAGKLLSLPWVMYASLVVSKLPAHGY
jgi:hypothetical protein